MFRRIEQTRPPLETVMAEYKRNPYQQSVRFPQGPSAQTVRAHPLCACVSNYMYPAPCPFAGEKNQNVVLDDDDEDGGTSAVNN